MKSIPFFDGHNDTILELFLEKRNFFQRSDVGHLDLERALEGGMRGGFFAFCIPAERIEEREASYGFKGSDEKWETEYAKSLNFEYADKFTKDLLELFFRLEALSSKIKIIKSKENLDECFSKDILGMVLHFEGAEAIDKKLMNLEEYYEKGLRSLGIVWSRANVFGFGVPFRFPSSSDIGDGLTKEGKELVLKCNDLGIIVDMAHLNQKGFWNVVKISKAPLVVSHGNVHALCPSSRNLTDEQIEAIKDSNGIIGVNFSVKFLRKDGKLILDTPLDIVLDHVDYIVKKIGVDHVGFGSDFDGTQIPSDLKDVSHMPKMMEALKKRGYKKSDIEKIAHLNWRRVIGDSWK
jgi:membrane dipeptidase